MKRRCVKSTSSDKRKKEAGEMNILKPADLNRVDLKRLTQSLERHDVTKIEVTKDGDIQILQQTKNGWRVQRAA